MRFGSEMDHGVDPLLLEQGGNQWLIADVSFDETIAVALFNGCQVVEIAGVGEQVKIHHPPVRTGSGDQVNEVAADKTAATGHQHISLFFHLFCVLKVAIISKKPILHNFSKAILPCDTREDVKH